jgi:cobyrinic acid a,c-diamide synthase
VVAGLSGDGGKTLLSLGLARSLCERGLVVRAAKKGPDFIDAAWLAAATGSPCVNLDTFMMRREGIGSGWWSLRGADVVVVEGNRGLYDGVDPGGTHSTAELAKLLGAPVVLVVDVTKTTRTAAAQVLGCRVLDPDLTIAGVVLNRVGTARQEALIRTAVEEITGLPVVGAIPKLTGDDPLPGRHLGLTLSLIHI